jgi:hypothetical protein
MDRITNTFFLSLALLSAGSASAAIFDTMDSVDQLKVIAASQTTKTDRMPAGKESAPANDEGAENKTAPEDAKTN